MLKYFRVRGQAEKVVPDLGAISTSLLESDAHLPVTIRQLNNRPENVKRRVYRGLIPPALLTRFGIDQFNGRREQFDYITLIVVDIKT